MKLYNEERKENFLEEKCWNEKTRASYKSLFYKTYEMEEFYEKDLCEFNMDQLIETLTALERLTFKSINKDLSIISQYITWCFVGGMVITAVNYADNITKEDLNKCLNKSAQSTMYIKDRAELYEICELIYNYQDKVLPVLFYESVRGRPSKEHSFEEIINLRAEDCDFENNTLYLTRNGIEEKRVVSNIDQRSMDIIRETINEEEYYVGNGETEGRIQSVVLNESDYVIKTAKRGSSDSEIKPSLINCRFVKIQRWIDKPNLTPTTCFQSGQLEKCRQIEDEKGYITMEDYEEVYKQFGLNPDKASLYNLKNLYENYKEIYAL